MAKKGIKICGQVDCNDWKKINKVLDCIHKGYKKGMGLIPDDFDLNWYARENGRYVVLLDYVTRSIVKLNANGFLTITKGDGKYYHSHFNKFVRENADKLDVWGFNKLPS